MGDELWAKELSPAITEEFSDLVLENNGKGLLRALVLDSKIDMEELKKHLIAEGILPFIMRNKLTNKIVLMIGPPLIIDKEGMQEIAKAITRALHKTQKTS